MEYGAPGFSFFGYLSEFCHPNFHSNSLAFELDKANGRLLLRYSTPAEKPEFEIIEYLTLANPFFVWLFDEFDAAIPRIE